jgi:hypothetical protein
VADERGALDRLEQDAGRVVEEVGEVGGWESNRAWKRLRHWMSLGSVLTVGYHVLVKSGSITAVRSNTVGPYADSPGAVVLPLIATIPALW